MVPGSSSFTSQCSRSSSTGRQRRKSTRASTARPSKICASALKVRISSTRSRPCSDEVSLAEGIIEAAEEMDSDLIVMGTHGRTGLSRLLMGSVAEHVLPKASCPVLMVKAGQHAAAPKSEQPVEELVPVP